MANFSRDSNHRALQLSYERKRNLLLVLNSDNTIEVFKVNVNKPEAILKKLVRQEKKKAAKRTHSEMEEQDDEAPVKRTVDKEQLQKKIDEGDYNVALHFSKKLSVTLDPQSKAKSFVTLQNSNEKMDLLVSYHSNSIMQYAVEIKKQKKEESKKE